MGILSDKYESAQCAPSVGLAVIVIATIDLRDPSAFGLKILVPSMIKYGESLIYHLGG